MAQRVKGKAVEDSQGTPESAAYRVTGYSSAGDSWVDRLNFRVADGTGVDGDKPFLRTNRPVASSLFLRDRDILYPVICPYQ